MNEELLNLMVEGETPEIRLRAMRELTIHVRNGTVSHEVRQAKGRLQLLDFNGIVEDRRLALQGGDEWKSRIRYLYSLRNNTQVTFL